MEGEGEATTTMKLRRVLPENLHQYIVLTEKYCCENETRKYHEASATFGTA